MTNGTSQRKSRRGILLGLFLVIGLPALGLGLANLTLATPWAKDWISAKLESRVGLKTRLDGISVTPWSGITIHQLEIAQPDQLVKRIDEPLIHISRIRIMPDWKQCLSKKLSAREIEIDGPRLVIPIELISAMAPPTPTPLAAPPIALNQAIPQNSPPAPSPTSPSPNASQPAPAQQATPTPATPTPAKAIAKPAPTPTTWCRLNHASLKLCSATTTAIDFEASGIHGSIPVRGKSTQSKLKIGKITSGDHQLAEAIDLPLQWASPKLSLGPLDTKIAGLDAELIAQVILRRGLLTEIIALFPAQALDDIHLPNGGVLNAKHVTARAHFLGFLQNPSTWQGECLSEVRNATLRIQQHDTRFDQGSSTTVLRGGRLSCLDARLVGEEASVLGNASLLSDGRFAAALRLVASPSHAQAVATTLFPHPPEAIPLTPLSTPQRAAFDLEAAGNLDQFSIRLGHRGPIINFNRGAPQQ